MTNILPLHQQASFAPWRAGSSSRISATPAFGGLSGKLALACRRGFTLIEILVIVIIILALIGFIAPAFAAWQKSSAKVQMASETLVAMQSSQTLRDGLRKADADSGSPRLPGITYAGTAVFFSYNDPADHGKGGLLRFANHNQYFPKNPSPPPKVFGDYIASETFTANGLTWNKIPYDLLSSIDPVRMPSGVGIAGVVRNDNGTPANPADDTVRLQDMPFAVCCGPDNYGLPPAPFVYCDLGGPGTPVPQQIPTVAPAVIVYLRSDVVKIGANPNDLSTLPGNSDQAKLNALLSQCRGLLVELAPQNGTAVAF